MNLFDYSQLILPLFEKLTIDDLNTQYQQSVTTMADIIGNTHSTSYEKIQRLADECHKMLKLTYANNSDNTVTQFFKRCFGIKPHSYGAVFTNFCQTVCNIKQYSMDGSINPNDSIELTTIHESLSSLPTHSNSTQLK